jgi:hypothetical protein
MTKMTQRFLTRSLTPHRILLALSFLIIIGPNLHANDTLFPTDDSLSSALTVELKLPLAELRKVKSEGEVAYPGYLQMTDGIRVPLKIKPRGKSRRTHCDFPPLWLDFEKKKLEGTIWAGQNKLKLVTHCSKKFAKREYLAHEMFVYRLLNLFTNNSFQVRALDITYVDTDSDRREQRFGFVIEHKKSLAMRLGGELIETPGLKLSELNAEHATFMSLFAYFIGNTDFSLRQGPDEDCCHNAVPIKIGAAIFPIPYDFDAAGLVDPPYAAPASNLSIRRVTQRLYRGYCEHNDHLESAIELFSNRRADVQSLIDRFNDVPGFRAKPVSAYLNKFYAIIDNPNQVRSKLIERCR